MSKTAVSIDEGTPVAVAESAMIQSISLMKNSNRSCPKSAALVHCIEKEERTSIASESELIGEFAVFEEKN